MRPSLPDSLTDFGLKAPFWEPKEILSNVVDGLRSRSVLLNHQSILEFLSI